MVRSEGESTDVIVFEQVGAKLRLAPGRRLGKRRPVRADTEDQATDPVEVTRVTVIPGQPLEEAEAREWLSRCGDADVAGEEIEAALRLVNRAIQAYRVSAGDPHAGDVARTQARRVRLGYGSGDELVDGRSREALTVPAPRERAGRRRMLAPQEQLAAILCGRSTVHVSEDLLLRARADLDAGRPRAAAVQARAALAALSSEPDSGAAGDHVELLDRLAARAVAGDLDAEQVERLDETLTQLERVVRRRRHSAGPR
jgi:hypothetical protein